jgi:hypothetical protein
VRENKLRFAPTYIIPTKGQQRKSQEKRGHLRAIDPYPEDHFPEAHMQFLVEQNTMIPINDFSFNFLKISALAIEKHDKNGIRTNRKPLLTFRTLIVEDHA